MTGIGLAQPEEDRPHHLSGEDLVIYRPLLTGDVFQDVPIKGLDGTFTVVIIGHPCTIRRGPHLSPEIPCCLVTDCERLPFEKWPEGHFALFPLPDIPDLGSPKGASLDSWVTVPSGELSRERRCLALSDEGILLLQQRFVHSLTRVVVDLPTLREHEAHVFVEAELEEDWLEDLAIDTTDLSPEIEEFDRFMGEDGRRSELRDPLLHSKVRKEVRREVRRRKDAL